MKCKKHLVPLVLIVLVLCTLGACFVCAQKRQEVLSDIYNDPVLSFRCSIESEFIEPVQDLLLPQMGAREFDCPGGRISIPVFTTNSYSCKYFGEALCYEDEYFEIAVTKINLSGTSFDSVVQIESELLASPMSLCMMSRSRFSLHRALLADKSKRRFGNGGVEIVDSSDQKSIFLYGLQRGDAQPCNATFWPSGDENWYVAAFINMKAGNINIRTLAHTIAADFRFQSAAPGVIGVSPKAPIKTVGE